MNHSSHCQYQNILFDLDGTLSESGPGITRSAQYALHKMGIDEPDLAKLTVFAGPPLNLTFHQYYHFNDEETVQAVRYFQERYNEKGVFETELYPGVKDMLRTLWEDDSRTLCLTSSKPEPLVQKVLDYLGIRSFFQIIVGSDMKDEADNKAGADNKQQMIAKTLQALDRPDLSRTVMVGDRLFDINGARGNHIASIGVTYGYGSREELENAGADRIAESVPELQALLME